MVNFPPFTTERPAGRGAPSRSHDIVTRDSEVASHTSMTSSSTLRVMILGGAMMNFGTTEEKQGITGLDDDKKIFFGGLPQWKFTDYCGWWADERIRADLEKGTRSRPRQEHVRTLESRLTRAYRDVLLFWAAKFLIESIKGKKGLLVVKESKALLIERPNILAGVKKVSAVRKYTSSFWACFPPLAVS